MNQDTYKRFLELLINDLDSVTKDFRKQVCICYDNFSGHKTKMILDFLAEREVWHMPTGKACYKANPIEGTFSLVKFIFQRNIDDLIQQAFDPVN